MLLFPHCLNAISKRVQFCCVSCMDWVRYLTVVYIGLSKISDHCMHWIELDIWLLYTLDWVRYLTIDYFLGCSDWSGAFSPPIVFPGVQPTDSIEDLSSCSLSPRKNFPMQGMVADSIGLEKGGSAILEFYRNNT